MEKPKLEKVLKPYGMDVSHRFFDVLDNLPSEEEWVADGRPHLWQACAADCDVVLWADSAYGHMAVTDGEKVIGYTRDRDALITDNKAYAVIAEYYGVDKPRLFKAI